MRIGLALIIMCLALGEAVAQANGQENGPASTSSKVAWVDPGWRPIVNRQTIRFEENGASTYDFEFEMLALDERGARALAQQVFQYDDYFTEFSLRDLATVKADGRIMPIDPRAVSDQSAGVDPSSPYFAEYRAKVVAYSDIQPNDRIRGRIVSKSKRIAFPGEFTGNWVNTQSSPPGTLDLTIDVPAAKSVQIRASNVEHTVAQVADRTVHHVLFRHDKAVPWSVDLDKDSSSQRFELSTFKDYAAFAAVINARNAAMAVPDEAVRAISNEIVGDASDRRTKAARLHNWVARHIRYVGIGLQDGGYTSQPASAALAARYGDCKAHATLLKALLAAQGIEANFVLVNSGGGFSITELATPNFDHAIAYLPEFDLYLDPTAELVSFGSLPKNLYGKPVLNTDTGVLSTIPLLKSDDFVLETKTELVLDASGSQKGRSTFTGIGVGATKQREDAVALENVDRNNLAARLLKGAKLDGGGDYIFSNPRDLADKFAIAAPFEVVAAADFTDLQRIRLLPFTTVSDSLSKMISGNVRERAFNCFSLENTESTSIKLPPGFHVFEKAGRFSLEKNLDGSTRYGNVKGKILMSGNFSVDGDTVLSERRAVFSFDAPVCPGAFGDELDAAFVKWDEHRRSQIALTLRPVKAIIEPGAKLYKGWKALKDGNYALALAELQPLAEQGDSDAQAYLGGMYRRGQGVEQDYRKAFEWYEKAAESGDVVSLSTLGWMYESGRGVGKNYARAADAYERASSQNYAYAQHRLGVLYQYGSGVPKDYKAAVDLYTKSADRGYADAQFDLGRLYEQGLGLTKDMERAKSLYAQAANQGHAAAKSRLADILAGQTR